MDSELNIRLLFIFAGVFALYEGFQNWLRGRIFEHPGLVLAHTVTYMMAFSLFLIGLLNDKHITWLDWYPLIVLIFTSFYSVYVVSEIVYKGVYRTDALAFSHYSAMEFVNQIKHGELFNPYTRDLQEALRIYSVDVDYITFKENGDIITSFNYPALHFLVFVPFVYLGWQDVRWIILLFEIASIVFIYIKAPQKIRPLVVLPLFAGSDLAINFTAGCVTDFLWMFPLIIAAFYMDEYPYIAGFFFGLSCATKQIPWLIAPFLLIWVLLSVKGKYSRRIFMAVVFAASSLVGFILPNIYFIRESFDAWVEGVFTPLTESLVFLSQGLSLFTQTGIISVQKEFYLFVMLWLFFILLLNYTVYFEKLKYTVWVYPMLILWASYRGLQNYFISWIPLLIVSLILWYKSVVEKDGVHS
ncbi:MAG: glycosyltransferase 87 family protein [Candidatus Bathyarchaeia archaeon]